MAFKRFHAFKAMADYAEHYYACFGFPQAPSPKTLRRRFLAFGPEHALTAFAQNVAGQAYYAGGEPATGESLLRASLMIRRELLPAGHWLLANGESLLGDCLDQLGRNEAAELMLKSGSEQLRDDRGAEHQKTIEARDRLHTFYEASGRGSEAAALDE